MSFFAPSAARARECRKAMDAVLWSSVRRVMGDTAQGGSNPGCADLLDYAAYFDLAMIPPGLAEVPASAKAEATARLRGRLAAARVADSEGCTPRVTNFSRDFRSGIELERMQRWWDIEPANRMALAGATGQEFDAGRRNVTVALDHLEQAASELHAEIRVIVRDIVLSAPDGTQLAEYGGASSLALWGALTINARNQTHWTQVLRQIVHEAAHNLLFALTMDQPALLDGASERRWSPVRPDPRPMDGIFHAAFVSAREAYAFDQLLCRHEQTGCLAAEEARAVEILMRPSIFAFWDCSRILRADAQLTALGEVILDDCETFMRDSFAIDADEAAPVAPY